MTDFAASKTRVSPAAPRRGGPMLPGGSEWSFESIAQYDREIARVAQAYGLVTYANQIEVISAEQMMDAYSSHGMPVGYTHWSYGKHYLSTEQTYRRGHMGLAYEIVINSDPCIAYLMEENTLPMQALVIAHACYGHNSFFKGNYLFRTWTHADSIIDYTAGKWEEDPLVGDVDVVFDTVGEAEGFAKAKKEGVLKADGAFISIGSFDAGLDPSAHPPLRFASFFCLSNNKEVQDALAGAIAAGQLVVPIEEEFPFTSEGVSALFAKQEGGKSKGKNILRIV
jgi:hypothetical protein